MRYQPGVQAAAPSGRGRHERRDAAGALLLVACASAALSGCDRLRVDPFGGAKILLTIDGAEPTPPGRHLELWVRTERDGASHVVRVLAGEGDRDPDGAPCEEGAPCPRAAYAIVPAVDLTDGCMIDREGHLLWQADALGVDGAPQGAAQAEAVRERIRQLTDRPARPLLVLAAWDDRSHERPVYRESLAPAERLARCEAFWSASPFAWTGNPSQLTRPVHGPFLGALDFQSTSPPQILGGIRLVTDWSLHDAVELWITETEATVAALDPAQLDCAASPTTCRGRVLLDGAVAPRAEAGHGALHVELRSPTVPGLRGAAAIQTRLDEAPEPF